MNNTEKQEKTTNPNEQTAINTNNTGNEDLLRMARRQAAEFEQERKQSEIELAKKDREIMELIRENTFTKKSAADKNKELNNLKMQSILEREVVLNTVDDQIQLTPEQESVRILSNVIAERRKKAELERAKKTDNTFYL
jgi:hypothetical protein